MPDGLKDCKENGRSLKESEGCSFLLQGVRLGGKEISGGTAG